VKYLIDTSALVRILRRQVDPIWRERAGAGLVSVCDPVLVETMTIAGAKEHVQLKQQLMDTYPWVSLPERVWESVWSVHDELAVHSAHRGLSVADLFVVAAALHHRLTVLHLDADFETVGRVVPEFQQERIS
jgi:predicted nucleic acid-binding protein